MEKAKSVPVGSRLGAPAERDPAAGNREPCKGSVGFFSILKKGGTNPTVSNREQSKMQLGEGRWNRQE